MKVWKRRDLLVGFIFFPALHNGNIPIPCLFFPSSLNRATLSIRKVPVTENVRNRKRWDKVSATLNMNSPQKPKLCLFIPTQNLGGNFVFSSLLLNQIVQKDVAQVQSSCYSFCTLLAVQHIWKLNVKLSPTTSMRCASQTRRLWFTTTLSKANLCKQNLNCWMKRRVQSSAPLLNSSTFSWQNYFFQYYLADVQEESRSQQIYHNLVIA